MTLSGTIFDILPHLQSKRLSPWEVLRFRKGNWNYKPCALSDYV